MRAQQLIKITDKQYIQAAKRLRMTMLVAFVWVHVYNDITQLHVHFSE